MFHFILSATLAILVVFALRMLLKGRVAPGWISALWLVAIVRMLLPAVPESPLSAMHLAAEATRWASESDNANDIWELDQFEPNKAESSALDEPLASPGPPTPLSTTDLSQPVQPNKSIDFPRQSDLAVPAVAPVSRGRAANPGTPALSPTTPVSPLERPSIAQVALGAWAAGFLFVIGLASFRTFAMRRILRAYERPASDGAHEQLAACKAEARVRRPIELFRHDTIAAPAVIGTLRPRIYLPSKSEETYTESDFRHIFLHELAHLRRWDGAVAWLTEIAVALHWFNPLAWLMRRGQRADRELACDEFALRQLGENAAKPYGETLLKVASSLSLSQPRPALSMARHTSEVTTRVRRIANRRPLARWRHPMAACGLAAAIALGATAAPDPTPAAPFPETSELAPEVGRFQVTVIAVPHERAAPVHLFEGDDAALLAKLTQMIDAGDARIETTIAASAGNRVRGKTERGQWVPTSNDLLLLEGAVDAVPYDSAPTLHGTLLEFEPSAHEGRVTAILHFTHAIGPVRTASFGDDLRLPTGRGKLEATEFPRIRISTRLLELQDEVPQLIGAVTPIPDSSERDAYFVFAKFDGLATPAPAPKNGNDNDSETPKFSFRVSGYTGSTSAPLASVSKAGDFHLCGAFDKEQRNADRGYYTRQYAGERAPRMTVTFETSGSAQANNEHAIRFQDSDVTVGTRVTLRRIAGEHRFAFTASSRDLVRVDTSADGSFLPVVRELSGAGEITLPPGSESILRSPSTKKGAWDYMYLNQIPRS